VQSSLLKECGLSESEFQRVLGENVDNVAIQHVFMNMQVEMTKLMVQHGIIAAQG
jgi:hypothetical protein